MADKVLKLQEFLRPAYIGVFAFTMLFWWGHPLADGSNFKSTLVRHEAAVQEKYKFLFLKLFKILFHRSLIGVSMVSD